MKNVLSILGTLSLFIVGCGLGKGNLIKFNDTLVGYENSLTPLVNATQTKLERFNAAEQFDSVEAVCIKMEKGIDETILKVKDLEAPSANGASKLKEAYLDYYKYAKGMYSKAREYASKKTDKERVDAFDEYNTYLGKASEEVSKLQAVQKEFAKANGFQVK